MNYLEVKANEAYTATATGGKPNKSNLADIWGNVLASFEDRDALVTAISNGDLDNSIDGNKVSVGDLIWVYEEDATAIPDMDDWLPLGNVCAEHFGAVGDGVTDDSAALQAAIDFSTHLVGDGIYEIRGVDISGDNKTVDFSNATITNNSTDGSDTFTFGNAAALKNFTLKLGNYESATTSGHMIKVVGQVRGLDLSWKEIQVGNVDKSAIRCYASEGGEIYGGNVYGWYTRGATGGQHAVEIIDLVADASPWQSLQGNVFRFSYAYGNSNDDDGRPIPFMQIKGVSPALLSKNDVYIEVGEILNGGAVHLERTTNSHIQVTTYDTTEWVGDIVASNIGRGNTYKVSRKGGTRTAKDWGSGAVEPYDLNLSNEQAPFIISAAINSTDEGKQYINLNGGTSAISSDTNVVLEGDGELKSLDKMGRVHAQASIASTGSIRFNTDFGIASSTRIDTGEYEITLDEDLPHDYWPVLVSAVSSGYSQFDIDAFPIYDLTDLSKIKVVTAVAGVKANKGFNILIMRP